MKRALFTLLSLFSFSATAIAELIVVEDRGGVSALPYYEALNSPEDQAKPPVSTITLLRDSSAIEAALLPVRSVWLSPGDEPRRAIRAPGLTPIFLIGDDERSRTWLQQRQAALREQRAVGLIVNVASIAALDRLRRLVPGLGLSPVSGDDLARRLGIRHYPVLITATGIEP
jgi:integrating conjugative element protein (TIGR03765 family)